MANDRVFINDIEIEGIETEVKVTYSIEDVKDIGSRNNAVTALIKAPATSKNRNTFGFAERINSSDYASQNNLYTARVETNTGSLKIFGKARFMRSVVSKDGYYEFYVVGDSGDWKTELANLSLKELDFRDQDHTYDEATINDSETVIPSRDYVYPVINRGLLGTIEYVSVENGKFMVEGTIPNIDHDSASNIIIDIQSNDGEAEAVYVSVATEPDGRHAITVNGDIASLGTGRGRIRRRDYNMGEVRVTDRRPAINIRSIFDKIYNSLGYKVESSFKDDELSRMYLLHEPDRVGVDPLQYGARVGVDPDTQKTVSWRAHHGSSAVYGDVRELMTTVTNSAGYLHGGRLPFNNDSQTDQYDPADGFDPIERKYIVQATGRYRGKVVGTMEVLGPNLQPHASFDAPLYWKFGMFLHLIRRKSDGTTTIIDSYKPQWSGSGFSAGAFPFEFQFDWADYEINDQLFISMTYGGANPFDSNIQMFNYGSINVDFKSDCRLIIEMEDGLPREGSQVSLTPFLPEISQIEFILALVHAFNLYIVTNPMTKTIYMETRDKFFTNRVVNLSGKVDHSKPIRIRETSEGMTRIQRYAYAEDPGDFFADQIAKRQGTPIHSSDGIIDNVFAKNEVTMVQNPLFAATHMKSTEQGSAATLRKLLLPTSWNDPGNDRFPNEPNRPKARILYYGGVKDLVLPDTWNWNGTVRTNIPHFFTYLNDEYTYQSLRFDDLPKSTGLHNRLHASRIKELNKGRIVDLYIHLEEKEIQGFAAAEKSFISDFRNRFYLDIDNEGAFFRMHKISGYKNSSNSVSCELIKEVGLHPIPRIPVAYYQCEILEYENPDQGQAFELKVKIKNVGGITGDPQDITISIPGLTPDHTFTIQLNAGDSQIVTANYIIPSAWEGQYQAIISGICNMVVPFYVQVSSSAPDFNLVGIIQATPNPVTQGGDLHISFTVENLGGTAGPFVGVIYVKNALTNQVLFLTSVNQSINGGEQVTFNTTFVDVPNVPNNQQLMRITVDGTGGVFDLQEVSVSPRPICSVEIAPNLTTGTLENAYYISQNFKSCTTGSVTKVIVELDVVNQPSQEPYISIQYGNGGPFNQVDIGFVQSQNIGNGIMIAEFLLGDIPVTNQEYLTVAIYGDGINNLRVTGAGQDVYADGGSGYYDINSGNHVALNDDIKITIEITED